MLAAEARFLFDYNYWANGRILDAAAEVGRDEFVAPAPLSHGSLRGTLVHTLSAEWIWRLRCQKGESPTAMLSEDEFPTLAALRDRWREEESAMRGFLAGLHDDDLLRTVPYRSTAGTPLASVLWLILAHVVNHGTQSRAEAAVLLTQYGSSPGDIDLIVFARERG